MSRLIWILCSLVFLSAEAKMGSGTVKPPRCRGLNGSSESCPWHWKIDSSRCSRTNPCSKLVVYFGGGGMRCDNLGEGIGFGEDRVLTDYAKAGYVAIAACFFETTDAALMPSHIQEKRVEELMHSIRASLVVRESWTGEDLLIAGLSQGATTPVVVWARSDLDDSPLFKASRYQGACFHDGVYDIRELNAFLLKEGCAWSRKKVLCPRYFGKGECPDELPELEHIEADSVTRVPPEDFAIRDWKLIECGSDKKDKCSVLGDTVPAGPIRALCENLGGQRCEWGSLPKQSHLYCSLHGSDRCRSWFEGKLAELRR